MYEKIKAEIQESIELKQHLLSDDFIAAIAKVADTISEAYKCGNKVLLCGNGGSATDAVHIEGELVGRFKKDRKGLSAIALGTSIASLTSIANDYGYESVFAREVEAWGNPGDVLLAFSTSGNSKNVIAAVNEAKTRDIKTIGFLGRDGGVLGSLVDLPLIIPSNDTARIQECHIMIGHIICGLVENENF